MCDYTCFKVSALIYQGESIPSVAAYARVYALRIPIASTKLIMNLTVHDTTRIILCYQFHLCIDTILYYTRYNIILKDEQLKH